MSPQGPAGQKQHLPSYGQPCPGSGQCRGEAVTPDHGVGSTQHSAVLTMTFSSKCSFSFVKGTEGRCRGGPGDWERVTWGRGVVSSPLWGALP